MLIARTGPAKLDRYEGESNTEQREKKRQKHSTQYHQSLPILEIETPCNHKKKVTVAGA